MKKMGNFTTYCFRHVSRYTDLNMGATTNATRPCGACRTDRSALTARLVASQVLNDKLFTLKEIYVSDESPVLRKLDTKHDHES